MLIVIDDYSPNEITKNLQLLIDQLNKVSDKILDQYSREPGEFCIKSPYEMIYDEIEGYMIELRKILHHYSNQLSKFPVDQQTDLNRLPNANYKYQYFLSSGSDLQLKKFKELLSPFIDDIPDQTFLNIFSGSQSEAQRKINWNGKQRNLCAYFIVEISRIMGFPKGDHIWLTASKYLTFNGQKITTSFRTNYKPNKIHSLRSKSDIDKALKIFSLPPST
jgi:hypothetical protein